MKWNVFAPRPSPVFRLPLLSDAGVVFIAYYLCKNVRIDIEMDLLPTEREREKSKMHESIRSRSTT